MWCGGREGGGPRKGGEERGREEGREGGREGEREKASRQKVDRCRHTGQLCRTRKTKKPGDGVEGGEQEFDSLFFHSCEGTGVGCCEACNREPLCTALIHWFPAAHESPTAAMTTVSVVLG